MFEREEGRRRPTINRRAAEKRDQLEMKKAGKVSGQVSRQEVVDWVEKSKISFERKNSERENLVKSWQRNSTPENRWVVDEIR